MPDKDTLSRRERQIMDAIYTRGEATAAEVLEALPDAPSYSAIRALLRILVDKGLLTHRQEGARYIYQPTEPVEQASRSALDQIVQTFFEGSVSNAVAALVDTKLPPEELDRLEEILRQARRP